MRIKCTEWRLVKIEKKKDGDEWIQRLTYQYRLPNSRVRYKHNRFVSKKNCYVIKIVLPGYKAGINFFKTSGGFGLSCGAHLQWRYSLVVFSPTDQQQLTETNTYEYTSEYLR